MTSLGRLLRTVLVAAITLVMTVPAASALPDPSTLLVSQNADGFTTNDEAYVTDVSADGRYVVFHTAATNVVPGLSGTYNDVFVRDMQTGAVELVSVSGSEVQGNARSWRGKISDDGRYVVFQSEATNLTAAETGGAWNVFLRDRTAGTTTQISTGLILAIGPNGDSAMPDISGDGTTVVFFSEASNIAFDDTNGVADIFRWRQGEWPSKIVSRNSSGVLGDAASGYNSLGVSYDGRYVAFQSFATNLAPAQGNPISTVPQVYVRDTVRDLTTCVSVSTGGFIADSGSSSPFITPNGRWVAFHSIASNLVAGDTNDARDIFVHDRWTGETERVSVSSSGQQDDPDTGLNEYPSISGDGLLVSWVAYGDDLVDSDNDATGDPTPDIYLRDRRTGTTYNGSVRSNGQNSNDDCFYGYLSADRSALVFDTLSTNLSLSDEDAYPDVYWNGLLENTASQTDVEGSNRYATAVAASEDAFPDGCDTVVIATGANWPDALGGASLAGVVGGPLLLTKPGSLPGAVITEITSLGATNAYILGGTAAVSQDVEDELDGLLSGSVTRLSGTNRYTTARDIADEVIDLLGDAYDGGSFISTGGNFPDALAGSPVAAFLGRPILLTKSTSAPDLPTEVESTVILGGTAVVSSTVENQLKTTLEAANVERIAGSNRYDTAARLAEYGIDWGMHWNEVAIATGQAFPDGLSGGAAAGQRGSVMLLTKTTSLSSNAKAKLQDNNDRIDQLYFIGGTAAVSADTRSTALQAIQ